jgi:CRISPR system Cascade subunit CasC
MNKNFLNIHVLISHSPSCLNRDDMNMQKSAIFGGQRRVRISSQSLKRAIRHSDYYKEHLGQPSDRSRNLEKLKNRFRLLLGDEYSAEIIDTTVDLFVKTTDQDSDEPDQEEVLDNDDTNEKKIAVAPWIAEEIRFLCGIIQRSRQQGLTEGEHQRALARFKRQKGKRRSEQYFIDEALAVKIKKELQEHQDALKSATSHAIDVALSGRMATSGLMTSVDGAMAVAHAITTHSVDADIDWFTAVDDLIEEAGDVGAGHLNTQEFGAGVFYRYASLNLRQLQENLNDASRQRVLEIGAHLVHLFATVVPSAKQQTFAAHNLADLVLVSFSDIPLSLANAFEKPIPNRGDGYLKPSADALVAYWEKVLKGYGLDDHARMFNLVDGVPVNSQVPTLQALQDWIKTDGLA